MDSPKRSETGLKLSETVGKQLYLLVLHYSRKAAISAGPTFKRKVVDSPKRSETGLKLSETVGKKLSLLVLHLYGK